MKLGIRRVGFITHWAKMSGLLVYDGGGNMSAHVMRNDRPFFAAKDPARGTDAEVRAAFEDYASYFGTYTIDQARQTVTHQVRGARYPNWRSATIRSVISSSKAIACYCPLRRSCGMANHSSTF
jgi:hypothetical protein